MTTKSREGAERSPSASVRLADAIDRHAPAVYRLAFRSLGNRADAERVTERVFREAATGLESAADDATRRANLVTAVCSAIVDVWRAYCSAPSARPDWPLDAVSLGDDPLDQTGAPGVSRILDLLDPSERRILVLRLIEGRSASETARALGVSEADALILQRQSLRRATDLGKEIHEDRAVSPARR